MYRRTTPQARADLIDKAHDVLLERGRIQGHFGTRNRKGGPVCSMGAVNVATGLHPNGGTVGDLRHLYAPGGPMEVRADVLWDLHDAVHALTGRELGLIGYNDADDVTDDDVFDLLRRTAKELRDG